MGFMGVFWVALVVVILVLAWPRLTHDTGERNPGESPLDILKKRYARGEIGKEEFEEKRRDLI
ncbi:MAG: SHOCT domain-containing protein [Deltaproteobacteria bacterium]|nr:SHOCT domain-containing protein [Deltaproteobacteria bacterium]